MRRGGLAAGDDGLTIVAGAGDDRIDGGAYDGYQLSLSGEVGNDTLLGGTQSDELWGGIGDDQLAGGKGNDSFDGGAGSDLLDGGLGNDRLTGGTGNDFFADIFGANVVTDFTLGEDKIVVAGGVRGVKSIVQDGDDTLITFAAIGAGTMRLVGINPEQLKNVDFTNDLAGSSKSEQLQGSTGWDVVRAGAGGDTVLGGDGSDCLYGDTGDDLMNGGLAADTMFGGDGNDELNGDLGKDTLSGGRGSDKLVGGDSADVLFGGTDLGADTLDGGEGVDTADYSSSVRGVVLDLSGKAGQIDKVPKGPPAVCISIEDAIGGSGDDVLIGTDGANRLEGGTGADTFTGGGGADTLVGGGGRDVYIYNALSDSTSTARDVIGHADADDLIDLSRIDADAIQTGDQAFHMGATADHTGDLVMTLDRAASVTLVSLYVDGDSTADAVIVLSGLHPGFDGFVL